MIEIDVRSSYARRDADTVWIELTLPADLALDDAEVFLRLVSEDGEKAVRVRANTSRSPAWRITAKVEASALPPGLWKLRVRIGAEGPLLFLRGRLLMTGREQPLALLPGPRPDTRMAPPERRRASGSASAGG